MTSVKRAGVIGAGVFGGHHARHWSSLPGAALAGVFDPHPERARTIVDKYGGEVFTECAALLDAVDVVSVTSPAVTHGSITLQALRAGKPAYVEKPLAASLDDADVIVREASERGLVVACGFSERAAFQALGLLSVRERPTLIEAVRVNPPGPRNLDVSVVLDLMIHDLDLCLLLGGVPVTVEAEGEFGSGRALDAANAEITFDSGAVARLRASRTAEAVSRSLSVTFPSGTVNVDLIKGTVVNRADFPLDEAFASSTLGGDRLRASLEAFLQAVNGKGSPLADAGDGTRALDLALAVERASEE